MRQPAPTGNVITVMFIPQSAGSKPRNIAPKPSSNPPPTAQADKNTSKAKPRKETKKNSESRVITVPQRYFPHPLLTLV